jgi:ethanolamine utilization protein EutA
MTDDPGGRIFFSSTGRTLDGDDEIRLLSVGLDIGSSTSHLVFSRIVLERLDARYVVSEREVFHQSAILLTPYVDADTIDAKALGDFIARTYQDAMIAPDEIDTGALILTGVAVTRSNARRIGELFAREAGKLVAVSAGDSLETVMAAHGSGAVARSIRNGRPVMNVDVGGGTSKIAIAAEGRVAAVTALDVGARLICCDADGTIRRVEAAGQRFGAELGLTLEPGRKLAEQAAHELAARMADGLFGAMRGGSPLVAGCGLLRLDPLAWRGPIGTLSFSGGVSEYIYGRETQGYGDLGAALGAEIRARVAAFGVPLAPPAERIRATVIGAAQYTTQVSGSTIFVSPLEAVPLRSVPVIAPRFAFDDEIDATAIAAAIRMLAAQLELAGKVAVFVPWRGSATFARLDAFCRGVVDGLAGVLAADAPIVLAGDSDVGGLLGIHLHQELKVTNPVVSIDGLELKDFDYIDIGTLLENSGAVPVVIKSLVFPPS